MLVLSQSDRFYELLQGDRIQDALELRLDELEAKAKAFHIGMASSKGTSLMLLAASVAGVSTLGATCWMMAGIGLVSYVHSVFADYGETQQLCWFSWNRKSLSALTADQSDKDDDGDSPLDEILSSLTPLERIEYLAVTTCTDAIAGYLKQHPSASRAEAYRRTLRQMYTHQDFTRLPLLETSEPTTPILVAPSAPVAVKLPETKLELPKPMGDVPKLFADDDIDESLIEDSWDEPQEKSAPVRVLAPTPHVPLPAPEEKSLSPLIEDLLDEGCVWLIGRKGSGKTSKVEWFVEQYLDLGYEVWIVDPHAKAGQWGDLKVFGRGMDYRSVERALAEYTNTIDHRYKRRSREANYDPMVNEKRLIIICEEMTKWGAQVDQEIMKSFMGCVLADLRKANAGCLFVSHGETLNMFGGQKALAGFRDAIDTDIAKLYTYSEPVPGSRPTQYRPKPMGKVLYPGDSVAREAMIGEMMQSQGRHFTPVRDLGKTEERPDNVIQLRRQA